jgi:hypothetical protein
LELGTNRDGREEVGVSNELGVRNAKVDWERVDLLDRSGSLLTALQWAQWLVLERRQFSVDTAPLRKRWQVALARLDHPT